MSLQLQELQRVSRKLRSPTHTWNVRAKPFCIVPICVAPVLPGETLKNATFQSRVVTDPIKNPLIGWWKEYYWFYVKHRDLQVQAFLDMMIDSTTSLAGYSDGTDSVDFYWEGAVNSVNWLKLAYEKIVANYFRDQGEAWNVATIGNYASAQINSNSWLDSATINADYEDDTFNVDLDADTTIEAHEISRSLMLWEHLRAQNLTEMTYEDYLRTYGVKVQPEVTESKPELLRYVREWSYPANTVEPTTGVPSSAVSWAFGERMDKDRYFKEPGFIIGITIARPKVYLSKQTGYAASHLDNAYAWLPAIMRDDPQTSLKKLTSASSILPAATPTGGYWIDVRDLFLYGDQFINFALTETDAGLVALPTNAMTNLRYPDETMVDALFSSSAKELVREDGVAKFSILGTQSDQTPRGNVMGFRM